MYALIVEIERMLKAFLLPLEREYFKAKILKILFNYQRIHDFIKKECYGRVAFT